MQAGANPSAPPLGVSRAPSRPLQYQPSPMAGNTSPFPPNQSAWGSYPSSSPVARGGVSGKGPLLQPVMTSKLAGACHSDGEVEQPGSAVSRKRKLVKVEADSRSSEGNTETSGRASDPREDAELKLQRRKQANRESARRSKLRKKEESESLSLRAQQLAMEGVMLRNELARLHAMCESLRAENSALSGQVSSCCGAAGVERVRASVAHASHSPTHSSLTDAFHDANCNIARPAALSPSAPDGASPPSAQVTPLAQQASLHQTSSGSAFTRVIKPVPRLGTSA
jgi:hypothetical protein